MKRRKPALRKNVLLHTIAREMGSAAGTIVRTTHALAASAANIVEAGKGKLSKASSQRSTAKKKMTTQKKKKVTKTSASGAQKRSSRDVA